MTHLAPRTLDGWMTAVNRRLERLERRPNLRLPKTDASALTGLVAFGNFTTTSPLVSGETIYATLTFPAAAGTLYRLAYRLNAQNDTLNGRISTRLRYEWGADVASDVSTSSLTLLLTQSAGAEFAGQDIAMNDWCLLRNDGATDVSVNLALSLTASTGTKAGVTAYRSGPLDIDSPPAGGASVVVESLGSGVSPSGAVVIG